MIRCLNFICHFGKSIKLEVYFFSFLFTRKRKVAIFLTQTYSSSFNIRQSGRIVCKFRRQKNVINLTDYVFAVPPVSPLFRFIRYPINDVFQTEVADKRFQKFGIGGIVKIPDNSKSLLEKIISLKPFFKSSATIFA